MFDYVHVMDVLSGVMAALTASTLARSRAPVVSSIDLTCTKKHRTERHFQGKARSDQVMHVWARRAFQP